MHIFRVRLRPRPRPCPHRTRSRPRMASTLPPAALHTRCNCAAYGRAYGGGGGGGGGGDRSRETYTKREIEAGGLGAREATRTIASDCERREGVQMGSGEGGYEETRCSHANGLFFARTLPLACSRYDNRHNSGSSFPTRPDSHILSVGGVGWSHLVHVQIYTVALPPHVSGTIRRVWFAEVYCWASRFMCCVGLWVQVQGVLSCDVGEGGDGRRRWSGIRETKGSKTRPATR
jgi:hypothetical protein